jgi:hypothetical protein
MREERRKIGQGVYFSQPLLITHVCGIRLYAHLYVREAVL